MQFNYYFLKHLSVSLQKELIDSTINSVFSQSKNELIISFNRTAEPFFIKADLDAEASLLSFPSSFARAKKNSIDLFAEILDLKVSGVRQFQNERTFSIELEKKFHLVFKLHGRRANVLLFKGQSVVSLFKNNIDKDLQLNINQFDRPIDQSDDALINSEFDLQSIFPTFDKNIKTYLKDNGFYESQVDQTRLEIIHTLLDQINDSHFHIIEKNELPKLTLLHSDQNAITLHNPIEASNKLAYQFYSKYQIQKTRNKHSTRINKDIKKCQSYISNSSSKLENIKNLRKYEEVANILMANLHLKVAFGTKEIELDDFYNNIKIMIKLKPSLSLQQNAEILYKKSKNQSKEVDNLKSNIKVKSDLLLGLKAQLIEIETIEDIKTFKLIEKKASITNKKKEPTPFIELYIDGYQVWIGKNAKNNDLLTQKYAKPNDLWLHARDVSGSHVVIRNPKGEKIPLHIVEKVAQLAAWHSKRKTDTLSPVIYTPKKYVRKPKGSYPGQVLVAKEEVILVEPTRTVKTD